MVGRSVCELACGLLVLGMLEPAGCARESMQAPAHVAGEYGSYFPAEHGTVLEFAADWGSGEPGVLVMEIFRPNASTVDIRIAGRTERWYLESDGIRNVEGGYLLHAPLAEHATFLGSDGVVEVTDVDRSVSVPAGRFDHCVQTVERRRKRAGERTITTVFCPGVGIVEQSKQSGSDVASLRLELKSYGARVVVAPHERAAVE